jgi:hypothetical protein
MAIQVGSDISQVERVKKSKNRHIFLHALDAQDVMHTVQKMMLL